MNLNFYNKEFDFIEVVLKIGPSNYFQAAKDQLTFIKAKQNSLKEDETRKNYYYNRSLILAYY